MQLLVLPGDGVGPEIIAAIEPILKWVELSVADLEIKSGTAGYSSYLLNGSTLTEDTLSEALRSDAVLFGSEDTEAFEGIPPDQRPGSGLLKLRQQMGVFANIRPCRVLPALSLQSPLRHEIVAGVDLVIVRELLGGLYFGRPRGIELLQDGRRRAVDSLVYHSDEIERIARAAFELARTRRHRLCSVDKANVLASGSLWREVVTTLGSREYSDVELSHMYVDNCAMQLVRAPKQFDVIVTENTFGDILSDCAAMISGSIGMLPSASLAAEVITGSRRGLYEAIHGSAPDIAGKDLANPIATVLSLAMALKHSLNAADQSSQLELAVEAVLNQGWRTRDLGEGRLVGTREMAHLIADRLN